MDRDRENTRPDFFIGEDEADRMACAAMPADRPTRFSWICRKDTISASRCRP